MPPKATDCHAHVFGPQHDYPLLPDTHFVPHETPFAAYRDMLRSIGCQRAVLVQPSVYGSDNRAIEHVLAQADAGIALRAVAVVEPDVADCELRRLHGLGFRGVRINLAAGTPGLRLAHALPLAERIAPLGWHLQFYADFEAHPEVGDTLARLPVPIVIDHFGRLQGGRDPKAPASRAMLELLQTGCCWIKLSGVYFVSHQAPHYEDMSTLVAAMLTTAPDRLIWGTDWPHISARARMPVDADLCDALATWIPDEAMRRRVLVDNPARLYGFEPVE